MSACTVERKTYQGWTNYETWCVNLWLSNDEPSYRYWRDEAKHAWDNSEATDVWTNSEAARFGLADRLKDHAEENAPDCGGMYGDLLGAALSEVNWSEISDAFLEEDFEGYESA